MSKDTQSARGAVLNKAFVLIENGGLTISKKFRALLYSIRPYQWVKNGLLFAGLLFSGNALNIPLLFKASAAAFLFCLLSGGIYLFNDILDLAADRKHPTKRNRPIASGQISVPFAWLSFGILITSALWGAFYLDEKFFVAAFAYFVLNILYTLKLKHVVILDVLTIAMGFVLRAVAGALVINVTISDWLLACTIALSLFLAVCKRRHEFVSLKDQSFAQRKILTEYNEKLLDQMIAALTACTILAYMLYTISPLTIDKFGTDRLVLTVPFIVYGIFRYLFLVYKKNGGGRPELILVTDRALLINIILYVMTVGYVIYF